MLRLLFEALHGEELDLDRHVARQHSGLVPLPIPLIQIDCQLMLERAILRTACWLLIQLVDLVLVKELIVDHFGVRFGFAKGCFRDANNHSNFEVLKLLEIVLVKKEELELVDPEGALEIEIVMHYIIEFVQFRQLALAQHTVPRVAHIKYYVIPMQLFDVSKRQLSVQDVLEMRLDLLD